MSGAGISAQLGFKIESTPGTGVTVDKFVELVSEGINVEPITLRSAGMRANRRTPHRLVRAGANINGPFTTPLSQHTIGTLFRAAMGAVSTTGSGPYTHVVTPGATVDDTLTIQVGRPRAASTTVDPYTFVGSSIVGFNFTASPGDTTEQQITWDMTAMDYATATSLASASYASGLAGFVWTQASLSVGGSARDVTSFGINYQNAMRRNHKTLSATAAGKSRQARENGIRTITGTLACDYDATTLRDAAYAGTELAFSAVFSNGTHSITFAGNIFPTEGDPNVTGPDILEQPFSFEFISSTSDAAAFTVTIVNGDATL